MWLWSAESIPYPGVDHLASAPHSHYHHAGCDPYTSTSAAEAPVHRLPAKHSRWNATGFASLDGQYERRPVERILRRNYLKQIA